MTINDINTAKSLYVINKYAKLYRDCRRDVKKYLFKHSEFDIGEIPQNRVDFFKRLNLYNALNLTIHNDYEEYDKDDNQNKNLREFEKMLEEISKYNEYVICDDNCENEITLDEYLELSDEEKEIYYLDGEMESYVSALEEFDFLEKDYTQQKELIDRVNSFLKRDSKDKKEQLYDLKASVLYKLKLPVDSYHVFEYDKANYYTFYKLAGFSFHSPIDMDCFDEDPENLREEAIREEIPSTLSDSEEFPDFDDAVDYLLRGILQYDDDMVKLFNNGKLASKISMLDLPPVGHTVNREYDETYDDYDYKYEPYYDDNYDDLMFD